MMEKPKIFHRNNKGKRLIHRNFILTKDVPFTHYLYWCEELDKVLELSVGDPIKVFDAYDENDHYLGQDWEYAVYCDGCGDLYIPDKDEVHEESYGQWYCEDCAKELIKCTECDQWQHSNFFTEQDEKINKEENTIVCDICIARKKAEEEFENEYKK